MSEINDWDIAAANNNDVPPDGWPENTMQYSEVNNTGREGMAVLARYFQDSNGALSTGGIADAYTLTLNAGHVAYFAGMYIAATFNATNTGATTIDVNGIGVQDIVDRGGLAGPGEHAVFARHVGAVPDSRRGVLGVRRQGDHQNERQGRE